MRAQLLHRVDEIERDVFKQLAQRKGYILLSEVMDIVQNMLTQLDRAIKEAKLPPETEKRLRGDLRRRLGTLMREPETQTRGESL